MLILWSLARETLSIQEASVSVCERLCFVHPSIDKLKLLAFCHTLYHCTANDNQSILQDGTLQPLSVYRGGQLSSQGKSDT